MWYYYITLIQILSSVKVVLELYNYTKIYKEIIYKETTRAGNTDTGREQNDYRFKQYMILNTDFVLDAAVF